MQDETTDEDSGGIAARHARSLLDGLGVAGIVASGADHPALAWRRAGLMAVTGQPDGPGLVAPAALTAAADGALLALRAIAPAGHYPLNGALLLGERARLLGLRAGGPVSANGSCRLIAARDGWLALNLPRPEDWELLHALFGHPAADWPGIKQAAATQPAAALIEQGRLLGLALAAAAPAPPATAPFAITRHGPGRAPAGAPLVIDLSALWAGPLAGSLLRAAGARVIKVESRNRPDGARFGSPDFFALLNAGKRCIALDLTTGEDVRMLHRLIAAADIVIEGSRPRALAQLGISAGDFARAGGTWVSITGHGRDGPAADWAGFGDDAAVAGGLASLMHSGWGARLFAGDAIADPLTGLAAAVAAWAGWRAGGGRVVALALAHVTAHAIGLHRAGVRELQAWQRMADADSAALYPLRSSAGAGQLGADNAMLADLSCLNAL